MSHLVYRMAFAGDVPWHGLGEQLPEDADTATMRRKAGLSWEPLLVELRCGDNGEVVGHRAIRRNDTRRMLAVVGPDWTPLSNADLFRFGEALASEGARWHIAGNLLGGKRVWVVMQTAGQVTIKRLEGDTEKELPFLLGYNTFDGSSSLEWILTSIRPVCNNTISAARFDANSNGAQNRWRKRHTAQMLRVDDLMKDARTVLGIASESRWKEHQDVMQALASARMKAKEFEVFTTCLFTREEDFDIAQERLAQARKEKARTASIFEANFETLQELFRRGKGNRGNCRYDALQSVTQYVDHAHAHSAEFVVKQIASGEGRHLNSALLGTGAAMKEMALHLLTRDMERKVLI